MSNTIPEWMPSVEVVKTDRDLPQRRDPRQGGQNQAQPSRKAPAEPELAEPPQSNTPHVGVLIDVRA